MDAIGYIRVSKDEQHESVKAQRGELEGWCAKHGRSLREVFEDVGISGGTELDKRPDLLAALNALRRGDVLLVVRRDRLARDTFTAAMVERITTKAGASIQAVHGDCNGNTPEMVLMRTMLDAFATYERALISMRTKAILDAKKARGEKTGGDVPYGFKTVGRDVKRLVANEGEQAIIQAAHELKEQGLSLRQIGAALAERGMLPRSGRAWHPESVSNLLKAWKDWAKRVTDWEQSEED